MKSLQVRLSNVQFMTLEEARRELSRVSGQVEARFGSNRFTSSRLTPTQRTQATQLRRIRARLRERIAALESLSPGKKVTND